MAYLRSAWHRMTVFVLVTILCMRRIASGGNSTTTPYKTTACRLCDFGAYCHFAGRCCFMPYEINDLWNNTIEQPKYECVETKLFSNKHETNYVLHDDEAFIQNVWMTTRCPSKTTNITLKELCENSDSSDNINSVVPVTDSVYHYKNQFCAECNGVNIRKMKNWKSEIFCDADLTLTSDVLSAVKRRKCNIFFRPPETIPVEKCVHARDTHTIEGCSVSKQLTVETIKVNKTCEKADFDPMKIKHKTYMCYTCNNMNPLSFSNGFCSLTALKVVADISPPFSAILDLSAIATQTSRGEDVKRQECEPSTQFTDSKMVKCRDIYCPEHRYLLKEECVRGISTLNTTGTCLMYVFFIKLTPLVQESTNQDDFTKDILEEDIFQNSLQQFFVSLVSAAGVKEFRIYEKSNNTDSTGRVIVEHLVVKLTIDISPFIVDIALYLYKNLHNVNLTFYPLIPFYSEVVSYEFFPWDVSKLKEPMPFGMKSISLGEVSIRNIKFQFESEFKCLIPFANHHTCPFVTVRFDELPTMYIEGSFLYVETNQSSVVLAEWNFKSNELENGAVDICLTEYKTIHDILTGHSVRRASGISSGVLSAKQYLAFFCTCLSIICLLLTLFIYLIFSELHSQPGINNIILCVCLFLAQTMYQFGAGQSSLSGWTCALIGGICHFLWLCVMFSMNVCSVEMYLVFRKFLKLPSTYTMKRTFRNILYIIFASLSLVLVNIFVSLSLSQGQDIGYGGNICYLSSKTLHLITFVIPSLALTLSNVVLFVLVVLRISKTYISSLNLNQERNYLAVYMRLSTITGLTWVFGYLHLLLSFEALEYVFIILNASQGVFIMIAFVANKRVLSLLCQKKSPTSKDTSNVDSLAKC